MSTRSKRYPTCCLGYIPDIIGIIQTQLDVDIYVYEVHDQQYGILKNGSWNGLIGDLLSGEADIACDILSVTSARQHVVDFTDSFRLTKLVLVTISQWHPLPYINLEAFDALQTDVWISIITVTILSSLLIYAAEWIVHSQTPENSWSKTLLYAVGLLFQRDIGGSDPNRHGARYIAVAIAAGFMVVMTGYTSCFDGEKCDFCENSSN